MLSNFWCTENELYWITCGDPMCDWPTNCLKWNGLLDGHPQIKHLVSQKYLQNKASPQASHSRNTTNTTVLPVINIGLEISQSELKHCAINKGKKLTRGKSTAKTAATGIMKNNKLFSSLVKSLYKISIVSTQKAHTYSKNWCLTTSSNTVFCSCWYL